MAGQAAHRRRRARCFAKPSRRTGSQHPCATIRYLINLASPDKELWQKSVDALRRTNCERAEALGHSTASSCIPARPPRQRGRRPQAHRRRASNEVHPAHARASKTQVWLEATAGQGSCLGCRFEHLAPSGAASNDPSASAGLHRHLPHLRRRLSARHRDRIQGDDCSSSMTSSASNCVRAFHLNDSKKPLGSRVDRHAHIGEGKIGIGAFRWLLNDKRFQVAADVPGDQEGETRGRGDGRRQYANAAVVVEIVAVCSAKDAVALANAEIAKICLYCGSIRVSSSDAIKTDAAFAERRSLCLLLHTPRRPTTHPPGRADGNRTAAAGRRVEDAIVVGRRDSRCTQRAGRDSSRLCGSRRGDRDGQHVSHTCRQSRCGGLERPALELHGAGCGDRPRRSAGRAWIAGSIAPVADCYSPDATPGDQVLTAAHQAHAENLQQSGVDLMLVETQVTIREAVIAARAAVATGLPTLVSFVVGSDGRLLSGESLIDAARAVMSLGVQGVLVNCLPVERVPDCLAQLKSVAGTVPIGAYANAGWMRRDGTWEPSIGADPIAYGKAAEEWLNAALTSSVAVAVRRSSTFGSCANRAKKCDPGRLPPHTLAACRASPEHGGDVDGSTLSPHDTSHLRS